MSARLLQMKDNNCKKIFISWSGEISKEIAKGLKEVLEKQVFTDNRFSCFVSDLDIASGSDWWDKIKDELQTCKIGILCITKENLKSPWLFFEFGALISQGIPTIPLLISCSLNSLKGTPLTGRQCVDFYNESKFIDMILDINEILQLLNIDKEQQRLIYANAYCSLKTRLADHLKRLKEKRLFNEKNIYPSSISTITKNTIYISVPMSSINENDYRIFRQFVLKISKGLKKIGFTEVICPMIEIKDKSKFDGQTRAIKVNFEKMKQVDSMLVIYPYNLPSSVLVELGYGIALSKELVIFYRSDLPYIVEKAGQIINHVKTYKYEKLNDIIKSISENGMLLFEGDNDE